MSISYSQVQHFLTTVKYMNMNRAAQELFISQPGLSLSIARLESELGVSLFRRDNNKLTLSEAGTVLRPYLEQLQFDTDILLRTANELAHPKIKDVNISFSGSSYFFSSLLVAGPLEQQNIVAKFCYVTLEQAVNMLLTGQVDFSISSIPIKHPKITTEDVLEASIGLVVLHSHPLAQHKSVSIDDLLKEKIHGLLPDSSFRQTCDAFFAENGIEISYFTEESSLAYRKRIAAQECLGGFLSMYSTFKESFRVMGDYVFLPFRDMNPTQKITISYLTAGNRQHSYADFLHAIKKHIIEVDAVHAHVSNILSSEGIKQQKTNHG